MQMLEQISKHINTENDSYIVAKKLVDSKMLIYFEKKATSIK